MNGGAIFLGTGATANLDNNKGNVIFSGNTATGEAGSSLGAAVYGSGGAATAFSASGNSGQVAFTNNAASGKKANGAAIYMDKGSVSMDGNGSVLISGNHADNTTTSISKMYGGAIYATGLLSISGNTGTVTIENNYFGAVPKNKRDASSEKVSSWFGLTIHPSGKPAVEAVTTSLASPAPTEIHKLIVQSFFSASSV